MLFQDPFLPNSLPPALIPTPSLHFSALNRSPELASIDYAVADLTSIVPGAMAPVYGKNIAKSQYIASVGKVVAMVAAFWLRRNFRSSLLVSSAKTTKEAIAEVQNAWSKRLPSYAFPRVDRIFDVRNVDGVLTVTFKQTFLAHMKKMIGESNTTATFHVVNALQIPYMVGAMKAANLYLDKKGGLWLGGDYNPNMGLGGRADPVTRKYQAGSPFALVDLMSRLETRSLLSKSDSDEMVAMMSVNSSFSRRLASPWNTTTQAYGKLGVYEWKTYGDQRSDASVLRRAVNVAGTSVSVRYAIAVTKVRNLANLTFLIDRVDEALAKTHRAGMAVVR
ncbi:MAG: serine hydrolase [Planctomycetota bacterium]